MALRIDPVRIHVAPYCSDVLRHQVRNNPRRLGAKPLSGRCWQLSPKHWHFEDFPSCAEIQKGGVPVEMAGCARTALRMKVGFLSSCKHHRLHQLYGQLLYPQIDLLTVPSTGQVLGETRSKTEAKFFFEFEARIWSLRFDFIRGWRWSHDLGKSKGGGVRVRPRLLTH